jgi:hypothetical protein
MLLIGLYVGGFVAVFWLVFWFAVYATPPNYRVESVGFALVIAFVLAALWPVSVPSYPFWFRR